MRTLIRLLAATACVAAFGTASAQRAVNFNVFLSGEQEVPPVVTATSGHAILHADRSGTQIRFSLDVRDADRALGAAGAHLHCAPAGQNGPVVAFLAGSFPPGYDGRFRITATLNDGSIVNPACGATIAELVESMQMGDVYINVHSTDHPSGVIRGQIQ